MFEDSDFTNGAQLAASDTGCEAYFARAIASGEYRGWLAVTAAGEAVASGGLVVDRHPPGPDNHSGRIAYIMNLAADRAHRRQGLARGIFEHIMARVRAKGLTMASLHATEIGRPLFQSNGFSDTNEMRARVAPVVGTTTAD